MDPRDEGKGWYGIDLDGTLAHQDDGPHDDDYVGEPIPEMVTRVKKWLKEGKEIKIFTARYPKGLVAIRRWCAEHLGQQLEITNKKDKNCICIYDDRAVQVVHIKGELV